MDIEEAISRINYDQDDAMREERIAAESIRRLVTLATRNGDSWRAAELTKALALLEGVDT